MTRWVVLQLDSSYVGSISLLSVEIPQSLVSGLLIFSLSHVHTCIVLLILFYVAHKFTSPSLTFSSKLWNLRTTLSLVSSLGFSMPIYHLVLLIDYLKHLAKLFIASFSTPFTLAWTLTAS